MKEKVVSGGKINLFKTIKAANSLSDSFFMSGIINNSKDVDDEIFLYNFENKINLVNNSEKVASLSIYNIAGQLIITKNTINQTETIDLSNFSKGLYFIEIKSSDNYKYFKINTNRY